MRRISVPVVLVVLVGALVAGCTGSGASDSAGRDDSESSQEQAPVGVAADAALEPSSDGTSATVDRQVVTTGSIGIVVADPAAAAQRASELTEAAGGRVEARSERAQSGDQPPSAQLVVRIPAARLTETLDRFRELGDVERVETSSSDVTDTVQDLDARISSLTVSVARLESLMGAATSSTDLVALESALSSRQADLESMQARLASLAGQVELSTITVDLTATPTVPAASPGGFGTALESGWASLLATLAGALVVLGVVLPWLLFFGLIGLGVLVVTRVVRKRRTVTP